MNKELENNIAKLSKKLLSLFVFASLVLSSCGGGGDSNATKTQDAYDATATNASILFESQLAAIAGTQAAETTPTKTPFQPLSVTPTR